MATYLNNSVAMHVWHADVFTEYVKQLSSSGTGMLASDMVTWRKYMPIEIEEEKDPDDDLFD